LEEAEMWAIGFGDFVHLKEEIGSVSQEIWDFAAEITDFVTGLAIGWVIFSFGIGSDLF
jgi:hypothetical protein